MTGLFSESFLKKYWRFTRTDDHNNHFITIGIFYRPINFIIELCGRIYELRLPRYNLNDTYPLDENGYTKVTHSLLLEYGRYYADGPLLFENIKDIKFESKTIHNLVLHINMYYSKGHIACFNAINVENIVVENTIIKFHLK